MTVMAFSRNASQVAGGGWRWHPAERSFGAAAFPVAAAEGADSEEEGPRPGCVGTCAPRDRRRTRRDGRCGGFTTRLHC